MREEVSSFISRFGTTKAGGVRDVDDKGRGADDDECEEDNTYVVLLGA
jgi:hypothetical protein